MYHLSGIENLKKTISSRELNTILEKSNEFQTRTLNKLYEKPVKQELLSNICSRVFCKKSSEDDQIFSLKPKRLIREFINNELLREISEAVDILHKEDRFSLTQRDTYLNSGLKYYSKRFILSVQLLLLKLPHLKWLKVFAIIKLLKISHSA